MIFASEFLMWCEVFGVDTGGNVPSNITLQAVYNNSNPAQIDISARNLNFINGTFGINVGTFSPNASFQVDSTTQGVLGFPRMDSAQQGTLQGLLTSSDSGMFYYNTDFNILNYFDGSTTQNLLVISKIIQGANMAITDNGNGTVTFASSGGGFSATAIQGTFTSNTLATNTPVTPTSGDVPIAVEAGGFNVTHSLGANVEVFTVAGVQTAIIQNNSTGGRWCSVEFDLTMSVATSAGGTYTFTVYTNSGATLNFKKVTIPTTVPAFIDVSICSPMVFLNQNDYVYLRVSGTSVPAVSNFIAYYFNGKLIDTTIAGLPNTDALIQGSSNFWLSQDGGNTYQNVSGLPVTVGNVAVFTSTGGKISDGGIQPGQTDTIFTHQSLVGDFFPIFVQSSGNSFQQVGLNPAWSYQSDTNIMTVGAVTLSNLTAASTLLAVDSGKKTTNGTGFYSLGGLTFINGGGPILSTTPPVVFDPVLSDGSYIGMGGVGRNIGVFNGGALFYTYNLDYNGSTNTYIFNSNGNGCALEASSTGITLKGSTGGTAGNPVTPATLASFNSDGTVKINAASTASSLVATDPSGFLTSVPNLGFTSSATVTASTQTMALATIYINNYSGGQTAYTLPAATGSSKAIMLVSLTTSSTSGWQISAVGSDQIQYMRTLSATKGTLTSSSGSAVDCVTLIDVAAGLWLVYPSMGLDLTVV